MKKCDFCGRENEDALLCCYECGMELQSPEVPAPPTEADKPLAVLATFGDTVQASLLRAQLEQAGIEACIPEELDPSPFGNFLPLAHVTVRVAEKDLAAAKEVLAAAA